MQSTHESPSLPSAPWTLDLGASLIDPLSTRFRVWAPSARSVKVHLIESDRDPLLLERQDCGYYESIVPDVPPGTRYAYILDEDISRPDPASRYQPEGVHGPSEVVDPRAFAWTDTCWSGIPFETFIIYELHVGTFTLPGTFESIIPRLSYLKKEVGITAIELMPVAQCPGTRNWGYDGVNLFAPQANYGGPNGLKSLVDACHAHGLAVIMDVVYNHLGPEGNYLRDFGPYFTDRYTTPWGDAINYDGPDSDEVRSFMTANALYWIHEFHLDALRLDAVHAIYDFGAQHILHEMGEAVHNAGTQLGRPVTLIAESDLNDSRIISPVSRCGYGLDAQWNDDFHHALHTLLTGERDGYYQDFTGVEALATAMGQGYVYCGQPSSFRRRRHGNSAEHCRPSQFVVCAQNHDQIGNRARGDRLSTLVPWHALKVSAATVILSPNIPMLFMGEEYGETVPFQYFIDHGDSDLINAVRRGRKAEFASFACNYIPDPDDPATFTRSCLIPKLDTGTKQQALLQWYRMLISLRTSIPALGAVDDPNLLQAYSYETEKCLVVHRTLPSAQSALIFLSFNGATVSMLPPLVGGQWRLKLDSARSDFFGLGQMEAPPVLDFRPEEIVVELPSFAVWVYLRE